jgi:hypothetical protein
MAPRNWREKALADYLNALENTYALLGTEPNAGVAYAKVAEAISVPHWRFINLKTLMEDLGILRSEIEYNAVVNGKRTMGRRSTWQLVVPLEEAKARIIKWDKKGDSWEYEKRPGYVPKAPVGKGRFSKPELLVETAAEYAGNHIATDSLAAMMEAESRFQEEPPVTIAKTEREETRAIAGPEPEKTFAALASLRKDEPAALVEAARQYSNRQNAVEKQYQSLVTMGLDVDKEKFLASISLPRDEFLEAISLVLPLVTSLQNQNDYLLNQLNTARDRIKDYAEVKHSYERLQKRWNERVAEKVANG